MRRAVAAALLLALAACGQRADLKPLADKQLPPAPYGSDTRKSAEELLAPPVQAVPERSVELRKRSEERADDPFDLPPRE
jgi:predicted small lipoprotein YifL